VATLSAFVLVLALGYFVYCIATLPLDGGLEPEPTPSALVVEADNGDVFATRGVFKGDKLSAEEVPINLARAVVAIEDRRFYEHHGIDLFALLRAAYRNLTAGGVREGGSTITQQLARIAYLSPERTFKRKLQEAMLAIWLEHQLSKEEILTRYLNTAYFGANAYGVDAAAKRYFGKSAKDVSLSEAAMLAGLVRAPSALAPHRNLDGARERAALVLGAMVETGTLSGEQADAARQRPATLRVPPETPPGTNYFLDLADSDARRAAGSAAADLILRTTLDLDLQQVAERVIAHRLKTEGRVKKVSQAALVAMTPDGAILSMVGGRDYGESQFNRVTQAKRQPGSLFKTFVYLAAHEKGFGPQSTMTDRPIQVGDWEPQNYGGRFRGTVTLRTAFANSINSIAVQLSDAIGIRSVIETARRLGVQSELPPVPSLALGSAEVTLLEMTGAFAANAANAERVEPYAVRTIRNGDEVLYTRSNSFASAKHPDARATIRDLLTAVVREGTGRAAQINGLVAGKTGTSQEHRDAWFVGFTSNLVVGVWVGNDDNKPTKNVTGGDLPARIWHDFVTRAGAARSRLARYQPAMTGIGGRAEAKSGPSNVAVVRGAAVVVDTATLSIQGRVVRLYGVEGATGQMSSDFRQYLGEREVVCEQAGSRDAYRCHVDDQDLSRVVLFNGGGRATADATPDLKAAEQHARTAGLAIWGANRAKKMQGK
jgi:1A family penicillin-binding protein